ncbi:MAG: LysR family transcriptional regulator [Desulfamplus sp.]|nr:LysR family transcriptional regulator [Desulfamplus sp.]MBF0259766.1 LysR family transcriptional regulator [Desulfamplus sp.]
MDLWQLKVFASVVDQKSFSKAGEAIFLSQPTVSSHIKELEDHFKCRLIDRLGREALPTKAGEILYDYAKRLLCLKEETEAGIASFLGNARGNLTIGGSSIPSTYIIPGVLGSFTKKYPDVSLSVVTGDTSEIQDAIIKGDVEAGIVGAKIKEGGTVLRQEKLIEDEMKLIVCASNPLADRTFVDMDCLLKEPFIGREKGSGTWDSISKAIAESGLNCTSDDLKISVRLGSNASVIQGILNNAGVSIISTIAVQDYIEAGRLKALSVNGLNLRRHFFLTTHKKRTLSPLAILFIDFIKEEFEVKI